VYGLAVQRDPPKAFCVPKFPPKLREPNPRSGSVTDDQYKALQAKRKHRWLRAAAPGIQLRLSQGRTAWAARLRGLRVNQVDLKARTVRLLLGTTKNDRGRTVVMTDEVHRLISECVAGKQPDDAVFT
jgi:integrase